MVRTQIYLTEEQRRRLHRISKETRRRQSELIREAVDEYLEAAEDDRNEKILREAAGLWRERDDLADFSLLRQSWDRSK